ncbi:lymphocyte antigen 75-like [Mya arenaria]|uniref:lymphocyte antigen 75-like n=1 Tax=Mya arenaria TaxID=6604 RepID=UPI0022E1ED2D|nr:lymphocyte antigen 75-like [Mya arenaria]
MTSADRDACNTTRLCGVGESCLLKEVRSTGDGHTQFTMTCATDQICDGDEPLTVFGRRKRNVVMTCCKTDLCNTPTSIFSPSTSTVVSSSTTIKTTPQTVCDTSGGFQLLSFHEQMCVKLHRSSHKWDAARRICQAENADLVVLDTADKRRDVTNYVTSTIGHPVNYWIGLRDHLGADTFQWVNAVYVSNTDYQWGVGQPDQINQNCVFVKKEDHLWHDWLCSESFSFVCERNM